jgi:cell division septum initiation protein DivIVA
MPEKATPATELASQYIALVTGDLEANVKEQERINAEIASLQERLASLQHDHSVLVNMQQALGISTAPTLPAAEPESAAVPAPRRKKATTTPGGKQKARTSAAAPRKQAAGKPAAKATGTSKAAQPTLVELIRRHLTQQKEPRSAAEISAALGQAHPDRDVAAKVVRVTLEGLVAKSQAERTKQGRSVFYAAPASEPTAAPATETQSDDADH